MPERRLYDTRFFVEYFYSENNELLRKLKEELRSVKERMVSSLTIHEIHGINLKREGKEQSMTFITSSLKQNRQNRTAKKVHNFHIVGVIN